MLQPVAPVCLHPVSALSLPYLVLLVLCDSTSWKLHPGTQIRGLFGESAQRHCSSMCPLCPPCDGSQAHAVSLSVCRLIPLIVDLAGVVMASWCLAAPNGSAPPLVQRIGPAWHCTYLALRCESLIAHLAILASPSCCLLSPPSPPSSLCSLFRLPPFSASFFSVSFPLFSSFPLSLLLCLSFLLPSPPPPLLLLLPPPSSLPRSSLCLFPSLSAPLCAAGRFCSEWSGVGA